MGLGVPLGTGLADGNGGCFLPLLLVLRSQRAMLRSHVLRDLY